MPSVGISLRHLSKSFTKDNSAFKAVDDVNLEVAPGELVTLLGPSGCGKTTTLRMVAGFETPSSGEILMGGRDVTGIMVNKRHIGFVFQNYALFPHMSVFDNVAYGLRARKVASPEIRSKVTAVLGMVGLQKAEKRFPHQLSGGEQQRVALARVLILEPQVLLMDEPLSNLDAKLRVHMRTEIRRLQKQLGLTSLYVTHDQEEALTIADRIVVMNKGRVEQVDSPFEVYANPVSLFVADFIGKTNVFHAKAEVARAGNLDVAIYGQSLTVRSVPRKTFRSGDEVALLVRPECLRLSPVGQGRLKGHVTRSTFLGEKIEYEVRLASDQLLRVVQPAFRGATVYGEGMEVGIELDPADVVAIPA